MRLPRLAPAAAVSVVVALASLAAIQAFAAGQAIPTPIPAPSRTHLIAAAQAPSTQVTSSQTPATQPAPPLPPHRERPAPTNLKVLPRNLTGEQVHEIMEQWESELGTSCKTCHTPDPKNIAPNGKPRLNFADDSKKEKLTARRMVEMTAEINATYISKIDSSGAPVTCGTCHRGHLGPEPFKAPEEEPDHDHAH